MLCRTVCVAQPAQVGARAHLSAASLSTQHATPASRKQGAQDCLISRPRGEMVPLNMTSGAKQATTAGQEV